MFSFGSSNPFSVLKIRYRRVFPSVKLFSMTEISYVHSANDSFDSLEYSVKLKRNSPCEIHGKICVPI